MTTWADAREAAIAYLTASLSGDMDRADSIRAGYPGDGGPDELSAVAMGIVVGWLKLIRPELIGLFQADLQQFAAGTTWHDLGES